MLPSFRLATTVCFLKNSSEISLLSPNDRMWWMKILKPSRSTNQRLSLVFRRMIVLICCLLPVQMRLEHFHTLVAGRLCFSGIRGHRPIWKRNYYNSIRDCVTAVHYCSVMQYLPKSLGKCVKWLYNGTLRGALGTWHSLVRWRHLRGGLLGHGARSFHHDSVEAGSIPELEALPDWLVLEVAVEIVLVRGPRRVVD